MPAEFTVTPTVRDGCRVLVVEGELDVETSPELDAALEAAGDEPLIIDLSSVSFVDSSALHVLLKDRNGGRRPDAIVRERGSNVGRVLDIVKADKAIPLYDDVATAVEKLG